MIVTAKIGETGYATGEAAKHSSLVPESGAMPAGAALLLTRLLLAIAIMQAVTLLALGALVVECAPASPWTHAAAIAAHPDIAMATRIALRH